MGGGSLESTIFEFPLYLNTTIVEFDGEYTLKRPGDSLSEQLYDWCVANYERQSTSNSYSIPESLLEENPIFINGHQIKSIVFGYVWNFEFVDDYFYNGYEYIDGVAYGYSSFDTSTKDIILKFW